MPIINYQSNRPGIETFLNSRAFRYGEGFFTTLRVKNRVPVWLESHIQRLNRSLGDFGMGEIPTGELVQGVYRWIQENGLERGFLRITAWNEGGQTLANLDGSSIDEKRQPVKIITAPHCRHSSQPLLGYKTLNYWPNHLAYQEGLKKGFDEVLFLNERGEICEGSRSNIFWVYRNELYTPGESCGLLPGICREKVLELARKMGIRVHMGAYPVCALLEANEVFLTNSLRGIKKVAGFKNMSFPESVPSTDLISQAYDKRIDAYIYNFIKTI